MDTLALGASSPLIFFVSCTHTAGGLFPLSGEQGYPQPQVPILPDPEQLLTSQLEGPFLMGAFPDGKIRSLCPSFPLH